MKLSIVMPLLAASALALAGAAAHAQAVPQITQPISDTELTTLRGNVHPLVRAAQDLGAVPDATPTGVLTLTLKRSPAQENALRQFLAEAHSKGSTSYHKWLTPTQFGQKYGVADSDLAMVEGWLQSHGFRIEKVGAGRTAIEFSGTAGQVAGAFHTSLHTYKVSGQLHHANAANPQVPAALAPVIAGVGSLNDFHPTSQMKTLGRAEYNSATHQVTPQWTTPDGAGGVFYAVGPEDFATQYDVTPLYQAGTSGSGQTIGIINDSNINLDLVSAYRALYKLDGSSSTPNLPHIIIDGNDPGVTGDAGEAYLDVEMSGAVAPQATVNLYIAANTDFNDGLDLAMLRAVEDDVATVLSLSFSGCEAAEGAAGEAYINSLWEQAAAQGQTVMVSSGDSSSAGCDDDNNPFPAEDGLQVNGLASTPWNIAVGGTDFYYSDYATGGASSAQDWNTTNDANHGSLLHFIPEQPWNDSSYGLNILQVAGTSIAGGGGGQSTCAVVGGPLAGTNPLTAEGACEGLGGYAKPSWQAGSGVPSDQVRDLPDLSFFAANGLNNSFYAICASPGDCVNTDPATGDLYYTGVGGTSASTPAFAGIMALVNQKYGPQGQADFVLYPLAAKMPSVFHDVTVGSNNVPCQSPGGLQCVADKTGTGDSLQNWQATPGYDLASGLGSVDANALVTNWNSITFTPTTTVLSATPATITHGQTMTLVASVAENSGSTIPTGAVAVIADTTLPANKGQIALPLDANGSGAATVNFMPGGTYNIYGSYGGDGTYGTSQSASVSITVNPENSVIVASAFQNQTSPIPPQTPLGQSVSYGTIVGIDLQINGVNAASGSIDGIATGTVTVSDNGAAIATLPLNSNGATVLSLGTWTVGQHSLTFSYSGDSSYNATTTTTPKGPLTFTVTKGATQIGSVPNASSFNAGGTLIVQAEVAGVNSGLSPSGNAVFTLGSATQSVALSPTQNSESFATATFPNLAAGSYMLGIAYAGDANWSSVTATPQTVTVSGASALLASTTTLTSTPADLSGVQPGTQITLTATVTGSAAAPTGTILFVTDGLVFSSGSSDTIPLVPGSSKSSTAAITFNAGDAALGSNQVYAIYSGDSVYNTSNSPVVNFNNAQGDFSILNNNPTLTVVSGASGSATLTLSATNQFSGNVTLSCSVTGSGTNLPLCTVPASVMLATTGQVTASVQIATTPPASTSSQNMKPRNGWGWLTGGGGVAALACVLMLGVPSRRRGWQAMFGIFLCVALLGIAAGCGGGSMPASSTPPPVTPPPTPPPPASTTVPAGTYKAIITATGGAVVHNVQLNIVVTASAQ